MAHVPIRGGWGIAITGGIILGILAVVIAIIGSIGMLVVAPMIRSEVGKVAALEGPTTWEGGASCGGATVGVAIELVPSDGEDEDAVAATIRTYPGPPQDGKVVGEPTATFAAAGAVDGTSIVLDADEGAPWSRLDLQTDEKREPTVLSGDVVGDCTSVLLGRS